MGRLGSRSGLELCQVMLTSQTSPTLNRQESSSGLIFINDLLFNTVDSTVGWFASVVTTILLYIYKGNKSKYYIYHTVGKKGSEKHRVTMQLSPLPPVQQHILPVSLFMNCNSFEKLRQQT